MEVMTMNREKLAERIMFLCNHVHKDDPEGSICEDCNNEKGEDDSINL